MNQLTNQVIFVQEGSYFTRDQPHKTSQCLSTKNQERDFKEENEANLDEKEELASLIY